MSHIFITHARKDDASAQKLHDALKARGVESWLDLLDVQAEENWETEVDKALKSATHCILIMSKSTLKSPSVAYEYRYFLNAGIPIFIVAIESSDLTQLPQRLQDSPVMDMTQDYESRIDQLVELLTTNNDYREHVLRPSQSATFLPTRSRVTVSMDPSMRSVDPDVFTDLVEKLANVGFENIQVEAKNNE